MKKRVSILFLTFAFSISACGYALVGRGSSLPTNIRSIAIPQLENRTGEPNLDTIVTDIIRREFIKDGRLDVKNPSVADSVLKGVINSYLLSPLAYDASNNVTEYKVELTITLSHTSTRDKKVLMRQVVQNKWQFKVDPSITVAETSRMEATKEAAVKTAETVVTLVIESF